MPAQEALRFVNQVAAERMPRTEPDAAFCPAGKRWQVPIGSLEISDRIDSTV